MYDTLLQMGRWFGYRLGYEDLCRLWLTEDAASWYEHITLATAELRAEFKRMNRMGLTPRDFGLKVRSHPDSLIVTARIRMREARDFVHFVSLSENGLETTRLGLRLTSTLLTSARRPRSSRACRPLEKARSQSEKHGHSGAEYRGQRSLHSCRVFRATPQLQLQHGRDRRLLKVTEEDELQQWDRCHRKHARREPRWWR